MAAARRVVTFYTKTECSLCDAAKFVIKKVQQSGKVPLFDFREVDIMAGAERGPAIAAEAREAHALYAEHIPVVKVDGVEIARHRLVESDFLRHLATPPKR